MKARWRELGLVASPEWHWQLHENRALTVTLDDATARRLQQEARRLGMSLAECVGDLLSDRAGAACGPVAWSA